MSAEAVIAVARRPRSSSKSSRPTLTTSPSRRTARPCDRAHRRHQLRRSKSQTSDLVRTGASACACRGCGVCAGVTHRVRAARMPPRLVGRAGCRGHGKAQPRAPFHCSARTARTEAMVPTAARGKLGYERACAQSRPPTAGGESRSVRELPVVSTIVQQWLAELLRKDGRSIRAPSADPVSAGRVPDDDRRRGATRPSALLSASIARRTIWPRGSAHAQPSHCR